MKGTVKIISNARKIPHVFKERKKREKDRHRREHHGDHPSKHAVNAVKQRPREKARRVHPFKEKRQLQIDPIKKSCKPRRGVIRAIYGKPKDQNEQKEHHRISAPSAR